MEKYLQKYNERAKELLMPYLSKNSGVMDSYFARPGKILPIRRIKREITGELIRELRPPYSGDSRKGQAKKQLWPIIEKAATELGLERRLVSPGQQKGVFQGVKLNYSSDFKGSGMIYWINMDELIKQ